MGEAWRGGDYNMRKSQISNIAALKAETAANPYEAEPAKLSFYV